MSSGSYEIRTFCVLCGELADHDAEVRADADAEIAKLRAEREELETAKREVNEAHDYMEDGMSSYKWLQAYQHICIARAALAKVKGE